MQMEQVEWLVARPGRGESTEAGRPVLQCSSGPLTLTVQAIDYTICLIISIYWKQSELGSTRDCGERPLPILPMYLQSELPAHRQN